jgi:hypothetical protein
VSKRGREEGRLQDVEEGVRVVCEKKKSELGQLYRDN